MHRSAHNEDQIPCKQCQKPIAESYMKQHMEQKHGEQNEVQSEMGKLGRDYQLGKIDVVDVKTETMIQKRK